MIQAIVFDFGRVISAQKPESLFRGYEADLGLAPGSINTLMYESREWKEALVGRMSYEAFWLAVGPALGLTTEETIHSFHVRYMADEAVNRDVVGLINRLFGHYRLAVLSNFPPGLSQWLSDWNLLHLFDVVFCSGDEGVAKPDPSVFLMTLERLGVEPGQTVFIDDTVENVEAASGLGIHSILFTDYHSLTHALKAFVDPGILDA